MINRCDHGFIYLKRVGVGAPDRVINLRRWSGNFEPLIGMTTHFGSILSNEMDQAEDDIEEQKNGD